jgi:outer membrane lipoprotein-sorting protein
MKTMPCTLKSHASQMGECEARLGGTPPAKKLISWQNRGNTHNGQFISWGIIAVMGLAFGHDVAQAQTSSVASLLNKSLAVYEKARTFQGTMTLKESLAGQTRTVTMQIRAESGANGMTKRSVMNMKTSTGASMRMLDDGKTIYAVDNKSKIYRTTPHRPDKISGLLQSTFDKVRGVQNELKAKKVKQGKSTVYLITGKPQGSPTKIVINAANYQLESMTVTRTENGKPFTGGITLSGQKFNAPIPASAFVWKAPAGYKKGS